MALVVLFTVNIIIANDLKRINYKEVALIIYKTWFLLTFIEIEKTFLSVHYIGSDTFL